MQHNHSIFITLLIAAALSGRADTFSAEGLNYNVLSESDRTAEVTYKSTSRNYRDNAGYVSGEVTIPSQVVNGGVTYTVVSVGAHAFDYCADLTGVSIPETVTQIGTAAFSDTGLVELRIPDSVTSIGEELLAFDSKLVRLHLSSGITKIPNHAFMLCQSLVSVNIPEGVTSIGAAAFNLCDKLSVITCHAPTPPALYSGGSFINPEPSKAITLYVPAASLELYRNTPVWQDFNILSLSTYIENTVDTDTGVTAVYDLNGCRTTLSQPGIKILLTPRGPRRILVR